MSGQGPDGLAIRRDRRRRRRLSFALNLSSKQVGRVVLCEPFDAALKLSCIPDPALRFPLQRAVKCALHNRWGSRSVSRPEQNRARAGVSPPVLRSDVTRSVTRVVRATVSVSRRDTRFARRAVRHRRDRGADLGLHVTLDGRLRRAAAFFAPHERDLRAGLACSTSRMASVSIAPSLEL